MQKMKTPAKAPAKKYKPLIPPKAINNIIQELPEYRKKKVANIEFRRNIIESQNRDNYMNEYDRLRGFISTYTLPTLEDARIKQHMESLKKPYNRSINSSGSLYRDSMRKL